MAFVVLSGGVGGDLYLPAYSYGYFNDTVYVVNEVGTFTYTVRSYGGNDTVDLRDANSGNIHLVYSGRGNDTVLGGDAVDFVHDSDGNDVYSLGGNADRVYAGAGNDVSDGGAGVDLLSFHFLINNLGNFVFNTAAVKCDLKIATAQNLGVFGLDVFKSFENVTGGAGNDYFLGTEGKNNLLGVGGNDILDGRGGNDTVGGSQGSDTLIGGLGVDAMYCGGPDNARDHVRYYSTSESGRGTAPTVIDGIYEFDEGGGATDDKIDLSRIDARASTTTVNDAFTFRGASAFSLAGGEVRLQVIGADTLVHVDTDADAATEMNFRIVGVTGLTAADFIF